MKLSRFNSKTKASRSNSAGGEGITSRKPDSRFPKQVYRVGSEPDERFSLANERTFLAWIRTSLALISAGVGLAALNHAVPSIGHQVISLLLLLAGILAPLHAWWSWMRNERALRLHTPLPAPLIALPLAVFVFALGLALLLTL